MARARRWRRRCCAVARAARRPRRSRRSTWPRTAGHIVSRPPSTVAPTTCSTTPFRSWESSQLFVAIPTSLNAWRDAVRPQHQGVLRRDHRQPEGGRARLRRLSRRSPTTTASRLLVDKPRWPRPICASPSSMEPTFAVYLATKFSAAMPTSIERCHIVAVGVDYAKSGPLSPNLHRARPELPRGRLLGGCPNRSGPAQYILKSAPAATCAMCALAHRAAELVPLPPGSRDAQRPDGPHVANALAVAKWLEARRTEVEW